MSYRAYIRSRRRSLGALGVLAAVGSFACGSPHVDKPPAPDMSGLVEAYEEPNADFEPDDSEELVAALGVLDGLLDRTNLRTQLVEVLGEVLDEAVDLSSENDDLAIRVEADGYMLVTRICSGWTTPATPDREENGALLVTATFSDSGLDPIVWGSAAACRYLADEGRIQLDQRRGAEQGMAVYWGESPEKQGIEDRALLVDLNVNAEIEGELLPLDFDFRSLSDGRIEYRIPRGDGDLIAQVGADDRVRLRAGNGTFDCSQAFRCTLQRDGALEPDDRPEPVGD